MYIRLDRAHRALPVLLGIVTLASVAVLFVWDAFPRWFPARSHDFLAAFALTLIAVAYLAYQAAHRPQAKELAKAVMLAVAFLFWAAKIGEFENCQTCHQFCPKPFFDIFRLLLSSWSCGASFSPSMSAPPLPMAAGKSRCPMQR